MVKLAKPVILFDSDGNGNVLFDNMEDLLGILHRIEVSPMTVRQWEGRDETFSPEKFWFYTIGGMVNSIKWDYIKIHIDEFNDFNVEYVNESGEHEITFKRLAYRGCFPVYLPIGKYVKPYFKRRGYEW